MKIYKFYQQVKQEAEKVVWPERKELTVSLVIVTIAVLIFSIASMVLVFIPILGWLAIMGAYITVFIFWILGLIAAINGEKKVVPILGVFYQDLFKSIK